MDLTVSLMGVQCSNTCRTARFGELEATAVGDTLLGEHVGLRPLFQAAGVTSSPSSSDSSDESELPAGASGWCHIWLSSMLASKLSSVPHNPKQSTHMQPQV